VNDPRPPASGPIIPAISSSVRGPLGIAHLPRLWVKALAHQCKRLPSDYTSGNSGTDARLVDAFGLDPEAFFAFLATLPTYEATEAYVREHASTLDAERIAAFNADMDQAPTVMQADREDWDALHAAISTNVGMKMSVVVPLVSSMSMGPLGIRHLPRMWLKGLLHAAGALPNLWASGPTQIVFENGRPRLERVETGLDVQTYERLGLNMHDSCAFLLAQQPTYAAFEAYVAARARHLDPETVAAHNAAQWATDEESDARDRDEFHRLLLIARATP
jgi:hypothetical protein